MPYTMLATSQTPALIIYIVDVSGSMLNLLQGRRRIDVVTEALYAAFQSMVFRSTKGGRVLPRYRLAMFAYSDEVYDIFGGIKPIDQIAQMGVPELEPQRATNTALAFSEVENLLIKEMPNIQNCPAPLICHITDGEFSGMDPEPFIRRIMAMSNPDGNVLVENIFISEDVLTNPITTPTSWTGINMQTPLASDYAHRMRNYSSLLPVRYRSTMLEQGYAIGPDAFMMLPGASTDLVEMAFVMSMSTPISAPQ